jgi:hypothetical protein
MDNEKRTYRFGTEEICAPANLEPEQVRSMWAAFKIGGL